MRQDINGEWFISYRIKENLFIFTDEVKEENGWIHSNDVVADLNAIRSDIGCMQIKSKRHLIVHLVNSLKSKSRIRKAPNGKD